jgi:hypothetical protein
MLKKCNCPTCVTKIQVSNLGNIRYAHFPIKNNLNVKLNDDLENELMNYLLAEGGIGAQKLI